MLQIVFFGFFLFLLSADRASVHLGGGNLKYAYFLVPFLWTWHPKLMLKLAIDGIKKTPPMLAIGIVPLIFSVAFSFNRFQSLVWCGWLTFNLLTLISVFSFLKVNQFTSSRIRDSALLGLSLIAAAGLLQYICIYFFDFIVFSPQHHREFYRINGLAGWPHFLNIFSFLLLPLVLSFSEWRKWERPILFMVTYVLFQSTSKTGWVLFVALGAALFAFNRRGFFKKFLKFLVPISILFTILPTSPCGPYNLLGFKKLALFAQDANIEENSSGNERLLICLMGLKVFRKYPLVGVGPRAYSEYTASRFKSDFPGDYNWGLVGNTRNENIWVELLAENGLIFAALLWIALAFYLRPKILTPNNAILSGAWTSLILYYGMSGQFSQNILLTLVFAVWGIFFYALELETTR